MVSGHKMLERWFWSESSWALLQDIQSSSVRTRSGFQFPLGKTERRGGGEAKSYPIPSNTVSKLPSAANRVLKIVLHLIVLRPLIQDSGLFNSSLFCRPFIVNYSCEKKRHCSKTKITSFSERNCSEEIGGRRRFCCLAFEAPFNKTNETW